MRFVALRNPGFCTAVGAVYDRATFASGWAKCAVIDRAYSQQENLTGKSFTPSFPDKFSLGCVSELKVGIETNHCSLEARLNVQPHGFHRHIGIVITKSIHKIFMGVIELFQLPSALDAEPR